MTELSLLPESERERVDRLDGKILDLVCGGRGGTLNLALDDSEKTVLQCLRFRRGLDAAVPIRIIQERTKLDPRAIKQAVRTLRLNYNLPIGSWKHADRGGYYLIVTNADLKAWTKDVMDQVRAELSVLRAAAGNQASLELLGQLQLEAQKETEATHA